MTSRAAPLLALVAILAAAPAAAQVGAVVVRSPRPFGLFVGDLFTAEVEITAADGFAIEAASLPKPGPLSGWLDLRAISAAPGPLRDGERRWRLTLTYQTFYVALDARQLDVPGFPVTFAARAPAAVTTASAAVPGWSVGVSPLREVQPAPVDDPADFMRPPSPAPRRDPGPATQAALGLSVLALAALGLLAHDRAWWPFRRRPARAFAGALRQLRRLARSPDADAAYRGALLALHRGLDRTDGRRVLAEDLGAFLDRHPAYRPLGQPLARFFQASRETFFGRDPAEARAAWPLAEAVAVARRLAAAERRA
ncbi:nonribosomal peptide synthetase MxaA [Methylobacterium sp. ID0610]|uniref:nonribosomal peptide synthetase MxaA n=1 Tax=Methylobacterium carpenticola TaxID=3344827 RepID=UPI0036C8E4AF